MLWCQKQATEENTDTLYIIKTKNFCASKDTNKKVDDNPQHGKKVFVPYISDKGIVYRIY